MLTSKAFSDIVTFSRSSNATRIGPTGRVEYAPHNLALQSQTFDNASWTKTGTTIVPNSHVAPNGTVTADSLSGNGDVYQSVSYTPNTSVTFSVYAKGSGNIRVAMSDGSSGDTYCDFNLSTGTASAVVINGSWTGTITTITALQNGWYRCSVSSAKNAGIQILPILAALSGQVLWGAQLSVGPYPLDYTPTTSAAVYGPRFDYDPVTLAARGLLVEESRTNLLRYSEQFDNAAWGTQQTSISANSGIAPDGTNNADKLIADTSNAFHSLFQLVNGTADVYHTFSCYVKKAGHRYAGLYVDTGGGNLGGIIIDLDTGLSSATAASGQGVYLSSSVQALSNGWYRLILTGKFTSTNAYYFHIDLTNGFSFNAFSGNNTDGILIWGAQAEAGSFATSYIPTLASSVTRSADVASVNTLSPWYNSVEMTVYTEYDIIGKTSTFGMASQIDDGTLDNRIVNIGQETTGGDVQLGSFMNSGGSPSVNQYPISSMTVGSVYKLAFAVKTNDAATFVNGTSSVDGTAVVPSGLTTLRLGRRITDGYLNGHLRRLAYYSRRLTNVELTALTS